MFYRFIRAVFRVLAAVLMPTKVIGRERLKREGGYLQSSNGNGYSGTYGGMSQNDPLYGEIHFF